MPAEERTEIAKAIQDAGGEFAENAIRKNFLPTEIEAIRRALMPTEKTEARKRRTSNLPNGKLSRSEDEGRARDKVGDFAGVSGRMTFSLGTSSKRKRYKHPGHCPEGSKGETRDKVAEAERRQKPVSTPPLFVPYRRRACGCAML